MKKHEDGFEVRLAPRPSEAVRLQIPIDTLASLEKVAANRDMSLQALLRLYVGQGLRHDLARLYSDRFVETTAHVLARHLPSEDEVAAILREIQLEAAG
jgi:hypothetical protein